MSISVETRTRATGVTVNLPKSQTKSATFAENEPDGQQFNRYQPRTILGMKLWKLRQKIVVAGAPLLNWDELEQEVAERKGE